MAFESLGEKLQGIFKKLSGQSKLSESNMDDMLREVRLALLEADVSYKVVRDFVDDIKEKAIGQKVLQQLSPSQMVVKIVYEELVELLGSTDSELHMESGRPTAIMLVGLQGTGKTTSAAKLAYLFKNKQNKKCLMVACDIYRPAAIDQLETLGKEIGVEVYSDRSGTLPPDIASQAYKKALKEHYDIVIFDTAGRLQINDELMDELKNIQTQVPLSETLLLADAMSGQDAINVANAFNAKIKLTGVIMSKLDSDARGGSALSIRKMTGVPIKFAGTGEKVADLEIFHPDRMANRILGMGDVVSLVENVEENIDKEKAVKTTRKIMSGNFGLDDMLAMIHQIKKMGPLGKLLKMLPGMPKVSDEQLAKGEDNEKMMETIIFSMTSEERKHPEIIKNSRKVRIAEGSGTTAYDVNRVLKAFDQMKLSVKQMSPYMKKAAEQSMAEEAKKKN
ncbi:MAG: signal recognition particle protein [Bacilli bacterium]|jgi:signal recognition particle subunit SRP54|nr:signal recognition particle protein [Bacilli bacterium]